MSLPRIESVPLRDQAYRVLLEAIVSGRLAPGVRLRDQDLAHELNLSRTPVREALQRLADEGLVKTRPRSHTWVAPLDARTATDAFSVVAALHALAARLALPQWKPADTQRLMEANELLAEALSTLDPAAAVAADDRFHAVFVERAGNQELSGLLRSVTPKVRRLEWLQFSSLKGRQSVAQHQRIIEAVERADPDVPRLVEDNWWQLGLLVSAALRRASPDAPGLGSRTRLFDGP